MVNPHDRAIIIDHLRNCPSNFYNCISSKCLTTLRGMKRESSWNPNKEVEWFNIIIRMSTQLHSYYRHCLHNCKHMRNIRIGIKYRRFITVVVSLSFAWILIISFAFIKEEQQPVEVVYPGNYKRETLDILNQYNVNTGRKAQAPSMSAGVNNPVQKNTILIWTNIWGSQKHIVEGQKVFMDNMCPINNCYVTTNKSLANVSSAIVFHITDMYDSDFEFPRPRFLHQNWVFLLWESPEYTFGNLKWFRGKFNSTMTYRVDSDIYFPYAKVIPSAGKTNLNANSTNGKTFKEKKLVAWFASDCFTPSQRELYVNELQKYVEVDIYGKCGNLTCPKSETDECFKMLERNYKFYLSFENALCKDYVTEKVFNILNYNVVPIVLGFTNYTRDLPPRSFINVMDFQSPRLLATYLKELDHDEKQYLKYFDWKSGYHINTKRSDTVTWYTQGMCALCEYVNEPIQHKVYDDINKWWKTDADCDRELIPRLMKNW